MKSRKEKEALDEILIFPLNRRNNLSLLELCLVNFADPMKVKLHCHSLPVSNLDFLN